MPSELSEFDRELMEKLLAIPKDKWRLTSCRSGPGIRWYGTFQSGNVVVGMASLTYYGETSISHYVKIGDERASTNAAKLIYDELQSRFSEEIGGIHAEYRALEEKAAAIASAERARKERALIESISANPAAQHRVKVGGGSTPLPVDAGGWSWGAFLLNWIWVIFNAPALAWIAILVWIIPATALALGFYGNEWAWRYRKWESIEQFRRTQETWTKWGIVWAVCAVLALTAVAVWVLTSPQAR
jgi:hypothetical protein